MIVYVAFDIPGINSDDEEVDDIIEVLEESLDSFCYDWYIDEVRDDEVE
jgi:hypothetical protein